MVVIIMRESANWFLHAVALCIFVDYVTMWFKMTMKETH